MKANNRNQRRLVFTGGLAVLLCSALVLPASASLDSGRFQIRAYNADEPQYEATAGLTGTESTGTGGGGANQPVVGTVVDTMSCGAETVTVTEEMLAWSDQNRELVASGGIPELWPGGDWSFISEGKYTDLDREDFGTHEEVEIDRAYLFSTDPAAVANRDSLFLLREDEGFMKKSNHQVAYRENLEDIFASHLSEAQGDQPSMIGVYKYHDAYYDQYSPDMGDMEHCAYVKFEDGKVSSSDGNPAFEASHTWPWSTDSTAFYSKDGLPAFGEDRPSLVYTSVSSDSATTNTTELSYFAPNGEHWDYGVTSGYPKRSLQHPASKESATNGVASNDPTIWQNCFGDDCTLQSVNPTISKRSYVNWEGNTDTTYVAAELYNGARGINTVVGPDGVLKSQQYYHHNSQWGWGSGREPYSRTDGPAQTRILGGWLEYIYYIDGVRYWDQPSYEAAGGTGEWKEAVYVG